MSISSHKGLFITLEGIEGAGKSTHVDFIAEYFTQLGQQFVITREPGGTELGEAIRATLLSTDYQNKISENTELLLMFAARAQHIDEVILPVLKKGEIVICDRFTDSSFAYQGGGRGIEQLKIKRLKDWVQEGLTPDLTLLFDLPVELGLKRAGKRGKADRFESEKLDFFQSVRTCYLDLAKSESERIHIIDASQSIEKIQDEIQIILNSRLPK